MLIDTTLREGAQLFGAYFKMDTKQRILSGLLALGVDEIELGWIGQEGLTQLVKWAEPKAGKTSLSVWSPCRSEDIRKAAELNVDRVNIGVPVSDLHIKKRLGSNRDQLLKHLAKSIRTAVQLGIKYVSVGLEDASRADESFALKAALTAQAMGASRIRLADSLGILTPIRLMTLTHAFGNELSTDLAVHCHDDFGMATANAATALQSGVEYADCSVLGIGERSGIAATEELAAYFSLMEGKDEQTYQTDGIRALCDFISEAASVPIPRTKAIAGDDIFACESGIHVHALGKSPDLFEPYDPESIGAGRRLSVGGKSGRAAIRNALSENDIPHAEEDLPEITNAVKALSWRLERPLTATELRQLIRTN